MKTKKKRTPSAMRMIKSPHSPRNDALFREMLQLLVSKNNLKFTVSIEIPSEAFSEWSLGSVCQLYALSGETEDPTLGGIPSFLAFMNRSRLDNTSLQFPPQQNLQPCLAFYKINLLAKNRNPLMLTNTCNKKRERMNPIHKQQFVDKITTH